MTEVGPIEPGSGEVSCVPHPGMVEHRNGEGAGVTRMRWYSRAWLRAVSGAFALFCTAILTGALASADDVSGGVRGYVLGPDGKALNHATVYVVSADKRSPLSERTTDEHGFFTFLGLLPGRYFVEAWTSEDGLPWGCPPQVVVIPNSYISLMLHLRQLPRNISKAIIRDCSHLAWPDDGIIF